MIDKEEMEKLVEQYDLTIDSNAVSRFDVFSALLVSWNEKMNLTAITEPDEIVIKHFIDCLMILKYVDIEKGAKCVDVGCGAGFPGLPLLIASPGIEMTFNDALKKRLGFIEKVLKKCGLDAKLVHQRAEVLGKDEEYRETFDYATARAVAPMNVLCEYCLPLIKVGGRFIAMKGPDDDLTPAMNAVKELGGEVEHNVSYKLPNGDSRTLIVIKKISQTPTQYPRNTKKISTKPL